MHVHRGHSWGQIRAEGKRLNAGFLWELIVCSSYCYSNTRLCLKFNSWWNRYHTRSLLSEL